MNASFSKRFVGFVGMVALSLACLFGSTALAPAQQPLAAKQAIGETDTLLERLVLDESAGGAEAHQSRPRPLWGSQHSRAAAGEAPDLV